MTATNYPRVLRNNDLIYFRLRCRKFIEAIKSSTAASNVPVEDESERRRGKKATRSGGSFDHDGVFGHQMELDDHVGNSNATAIASGGDFMDTSDSVHRTTDLTAQFNVNSSNGIKDMDTQLLEYGQELRREFSADPRPEIRKELENTLALMVYSDPRQGPLADLLDDANRGRLAEDLNSAILGSCHSSLIFDTAHANFVTL